MIEVEKVSGIGEFLVEKFKPEEKDDFGGRKEEETRVFKTLGGKAFFVDRLHTIEVRTDKQLKNLLIKKYESVMESRYFGRGGVEIVKSGKQLNEAELCDLVRLSYNLSLE